MLYPSPYRPDIKEDEPPPKHRLKSQNAFSLEDDLPSDHCIVYFRRHDLVRGDCPQIIIEDHHIQNESFFNGYFGSVFS